MRQAGWSQDSETGGFTKVVRGQGAIRRTLWVSWRQAEDALRLADDGEKVAAVTPVSRSIEAVVAKASNEA